MNKPVEQNNEDRVQCKLCEGHVWMRKDRLQKHLEKVHSAKAAPKKSFTTYKARIASKYPPKLIIKGSNILPELAIKSKTIFFISNRNGQRAPSGKCTECGVEHQPIWLYQESTSGEVMLCEDCKPAVFERSFGN